MRSAEPGAVPAPAARRAASTHRALRAARAAGPKSARPAPESIRPRLPAQRPAQSAPSSPASPFRRKPESCRLPGIGAVDMNLPARPLHPRPARHPPPHPGTPPDLAILVPHRPGPRRRPGHTPPRQSDSRKPADSGKPVTATGPAGRTRSIRHLAGGRVPTTACRPRWRHRTHAQHLLAHLIAAGMAGRHLLSPWTVARPIYNGKTSSCSRVHGYVIYLPWTSAVLIRLSANRGWHGSNFFRNSICRGIRAALGRPAGPGA